MLRIHIPVMVLILLLSVNLSLASSFISNEEAFNIRGGCITGDCETGHTCGVLEPENGCGPAGNCHTDVTCNDWAKFIEYNLWSCKEGSSGECSRQPGTEVPCGPIYDCDCIYVDGKWKCFRDGSRGTQDEYFDCAPEQ